MKIVKSATELEIEITQSKIAGKSIGFVPTMGALHAGHKSLVERAKAENDFCVVSIFVNPTQFNNKTDLEKYPRKLESDAVLLENIGCDLIFAPASEDIYSKEEITDSFQFDFGGLDQVMEGKFRPGHFNGVVQIVSKLFSFVKPDKAYFGEKDFQQLAIIHRMVDILNLKVEIIDCPIIRESDGLAMSSRNERLSTADRKIAVSISKVLFESRNFATRYSPSELTDWVVSEVNAIQGLEIEYFEIADAVSLEKIQDWSKPSVGCIAVFCGDIRLIDNIRYFNN
jgi:pantoate--beta-alanine ligase